MDSEPFVEGLPSDTPPALLVRLSALWIDQAESIEPGYQRSGHGWHPNMTTAILMASMRAWWKLSLQSASDREVRYAVAVVDGVTRFVMLVDGWIGPRKDGRVAFRGFKITEGPIFDHLVGPNGKAVPSAPGAANPIRYWPPLQQSEQRPGPTPGVGPATPNRANPIQPAPRTTPVSNLPPPASPPLGTTFPTAPPTASPSAGDLGSDRPDEGEAHSSKSPQPKRLGLIETWRLMTAMQQDMTRIASAYADRAFAMRRADTVRQAFAQIDWRQLPECQIAIVGGCRLLEHPFGRGPVHRAAGRTRDTGSVVTTLARLLDRCRRASPSGRRHRTSCRPVIRGSSS